MIGPFGIAPMRETREKLGSLDASEPCECAECLRAGHGKPSVLAYCGMLRGVEHGNWIHGTELKILWENRAAVTAAMEKFRDAGKGQTA